MKAGVEQLRAAGRQAAAQGNWPRVRDMAARVLEREPQNPDGHFLHGLALRALGQLRQAIESLQAAVALDAARYDAAVELAAAYVAAYRFADARSLLDHYRPALWHSPRFLDLAGSLYTAMSQHATARELFARANELQPAVESIEMHLATSDVYLGRLDEARRIYRGILERNPDHQRAHYELAQSGTAGDRRHIGEMEAALGRAPDEPARNIFLHYALGKELEDIGDWEAAYMHFETAGAAAKSVSGYDVTVDVELIDTIIASCTAEWVADTSRSPHYSRTPIFIVGLPRTGTTLAERILSGHSKVQSAGETQLLQMVLRGGSRANNAIGITPQQIRRAAATRPPGEIAASYLEALGYRLGDEPFFTEKLPENVLYLGFIAKAWPEAPIVHLRRHPMDACFALFKQSYFRYAYTLDDLADYYLAYDRLTRHWRDTLGDRVLELCYEELVSDAEAQTRRLLQHTGLPYEAACLEFAGNDTPVATASAVQVRSAMHTRSVGKWRHFERQLEPLRKRLEQGGVDV